MWGLALACNRRSLPKNIPGLRREDAGSVWVMCPISRETGPTRLSIDARNSPDRGSLGGRCVQGRPIGSA
jgi:hypothetical protein